MNICTFRNTTWQLRGGIALVCLLLVSIPAMAQQTSGSIGGSIRDKQGAAVPGAAVRLIDQDRAAERQQASGTEGGFVFTPLAPSTYTLIVEASGFKKWEQKDIKVYSNDRLGLNDITLEVGQLTESITVEASTVQLQTESAEKSGVVTAQMFRDLAVRDRSFLSLIQTLPGVVGAGQFTANVNGLRNDAK